MIEIFKKCPEVPVSCLNFDEVSTFSTVTTLPENHCFLKILFCVEKKLFFWWFLINLTSFNSSKVIMFLTFNIYEKLNFEYTCFTHQILRSLWNIFPF